MSLSRQLWLCWLAVGAAATGGYFLVPQDTGWSSFYYNILSATSAAMIIVGIRLHRPTKARLWYLFAAGQGLWAVGDVVYGVDKFVLGRQFWPSESTRCTSPAIR
jgi:hypothetical protein